MAKHGIDTSISIISRSAPSNSPNKKIYGGQLPSKRTSSAVCSGRNIFGAVSCWKVTEDLAIQALALHPGMLPCHQPALGQDG